MIQLPFVLFGEAEKGNFHTGYFCHTLNQLRENFGNPPPDSHGLDLAIQTLLYKKDLLFFRVEEEGYSYDDYALGFDILLRQKAFDRIQALCMPGVGDEAILDAAEALCKASKCILVTQEPDLYDLLTDR